MGEQIQDLGFIRCDGPDGTKPVALVACAHTPGPWEARWRFGRLTTVSGRQRYPICDTSTAPVAHENIARNEANAILIAAAPDMLDALREAERFLDYFANDRREFFGPGTPRTAWQQVCAAIAKASPKPPASGLSASKGSDQP